MILVADSGSTKTEWILTNGDGVTKSFRTIGLNPYYIEEVDIKNTISINLLRNFERLDVKEVHFYGAGCGAELKRLVINNALKELFPQADVNVNTDILGAARALFGNEKGIACVLGTGANSCLYDGNEITALVSSPGYIFGDEGSGSHLGKTLITHYFKDTMPKGIKDAFLKKYNLIDSEILDAVYRNSFPNRYLASFSQFILEHSTDRFVREMIEESFNGFIDNYIRKHKNYKKVDIGFIGSIAYFFKKNLESAFKKQGLEIKVILKAPIEKLAEHHRVIKN